MGYPSPLSCVTIKKVKGRLIFSRYCDHKQASILLQRGECPSIVALVVLFMGVLASRIVNDC